MPYSEPGLDFVLNSSLRNISGDVFDTADEILPGRGAVTDTAGNFKESSLLNACALRGALREHL